ncbi:MAG TPA: hypothetical protein VJ183_07485 [Chloroflexia bacterium]|nr:hypothetical protein [Chloroflexia bacterium]
MTAPNNEHDPNTGSTADKSDIPSDSERARAGAELTAYLAEIHSRLPDVDEEEAERDIAEAIRAVRAERRRQQSADQQDT